MGRGIQIFRDNILSSSSVVFLDISTVVDVLPYLTTHESDYPVTQRQAPEEENHLASLFPYRSKKKAKAAIRVFGM
jgi:hypothetical protein